MKRYYSRIDWVLASIVWIPILLCWAISIPIIVGGVNTAMIIVSLTLILSTILIASIYTNTYYSIDTKYLHWRTGPFNGKIEINKITVIGRYDSMLSINSTMKPALSRHPLKVKYAKYDDMPFSPSDEMGFIDELLKVNDSIQVNAFDQSEVQAVS